MPTNTEDAGLEEKDPVLYHRNILKNFTFLIDLNVVSDRNSDLSTTCFFC